MHRTTPSRHGASQHQWAKTALSRLGKTVSQRSTLCIAILLTGCASVSPAPKQITSKPSSSLDGYFKYCAKAPELPECGGAAPVVTRQPRLADIYAVNHDVNHAISPRDDHSHFGVPDLWRRPLDGYGDCEDYALEKLHRLLELGWPIEALAIGIGNTLVNGYLAPEGFANKHAVLLVHFEDAVYVLDNLPRIVQDPATGKFLSKKEPYRVQHNLNINLELVQIPGKQEFARLSPIRNAAIGQEKPG